MGRLVSRKDFIRMATALLASQPENGVPKIVDIGCAIADIFGNDAINVDLMSLKEIKDMAKPCHGDIEIPNFVQANAESLPFRDKSFDVAVLSEILEHVTNPIAVLREASRVATYVIISVPNEYAWSPENKPFQHQHHVRNFTGASLIDMVRESGIFVIEYLDWQYAGWAYFIIIGK